MGDTNVECRNFHNENVSNVCAFVNATSSCGMDEGFINYTEFVYCSFSSHLVALGVVVLFIWWLFLFAGLAVTADNFFCPSLAVIARTLRLSHNIAGVTFLAFGNGAPDIFSAIAAIGNAKAGDAGLAIGALFGAGVFVTTVVAGAVSAVCPFDAMQRPFLRDIIFYLAAIFYAFYIIWKKYITTYEAIGFILMYVLYVLVVIVGRFIYQRNRSGRPISEEEAVTVSNEDIQTESDERRPLLGTQGTSDECRPLLGTQGTSDEPTVEIQQQSYSREPLKPATPFLEFRAAISPIDVTGWHDMNMFFKSYEVFKIPMVFLLKLTIPVVLNEESVKCGWNRHLNSLHCLTGPTYAIFAIHLAFENVGGKVPAVGIVIVAGFILACVVYFTSKNDQPPPYHAVFAYLGFLVAVIWIYTIANEIVNLLQTFGIVLNISNSIIGVTLLAWGNSIGDLIADVTMAKQGYPRMGISACFGGPLFNLLLGVGIPFTIACISQGGIFRLQVTLEELFLAGCVMASLISSLLIVPISGFRMSRGYGIYLLVFYLIFLIFALLIETDIIKNTNH